MNITKTISATTLATALIITPTLTTNTAQAATNPTTKTITSIIKNEIAKDTGYSPKRIYVKNIKISKNNKNFAGAIAGLSNAPHDPVEVILVRNGKTWKVTNYGTGGFECDTAPLNVIKEFKFEINNCTPSQKYYPFTKAQMKVNAAAMKRAAHYANPKTTKMSKKNTLNMLKFEKYPSYSISYVSTRFKANWAQNARLMAQEFMNSPIHFTRNEIQNSLTKDEGFTPAEVAYAIKIIPLNW